MSENLFLGDTTYPHLPDVEQLQSRIAHLESQLSTVTSRYNCVRDMTPEDFGNLSTINEEFDSLVDEIIRIEKYHIPNVGKMVQSQAQQPIVPRDFYTHKQSWRNALVIAEAHAKVHAHDVDDKAYWQHELRAFDRAYAELQSQTQQRCPIEPVQDEACSLCMSGEGSCLASQAQQPVVELLKQFEDCISKKTRIQFQPTFMTSDEKVTFDILEETIANLRGNIISGLQSQAQQESKELGHPYGIVDPDYARIYTQSRIIAWQYGYSCLMHGSFTRDLDLLLVPWEESARDNHDQLLKLIADACGLQFKDGEKEIYKAKVDWTNKPHGRKSCSLFFKEARDRRWIDIAVLPVSPPAPEGE